MQAAEESGQRWPDSWWHAASQWSFLDVFVILNGIALVAYAIIYARYFWATRRMPPRRDAPTHGAWTKPAPKRPT